MGKSCTLLKNDMKSKNQKLSEMKTELDKHLADLESNNTILQQKEELIDQLEKNLEKTSKELQEKNIHLLTGQRELQDKRTAST